MKNMLFLYVLVIILGVALVVGGTIGLLKARAQQSEELLPLVVTPEPFELSDPDQAPTWDPQQESRKKFNERQMAWRKQKQEVEQTEKEVDRLLQEKMSLTNSLINCKTPESLQALKEQLYQSQQHFDVAMARHHQELQKWKATLLTD